MERHSFSLKVKAVDDTGKFTGIGAVYNNVDLGNDRILPGAFARTLAAGKSIPLLWQHDPAQPIGSVKCIDGPQGLMVEGQLLLSDPTATKAYSFLKAGIIKGLSIGFDTVKSTMAGDVRELTELKLWEISVVTFPMNQSAMVTGIKAMSDDDRATHFKAIDRHRKSIDRAQRAIREHTKALFDGLDDDDDEPLNDSTRLEPGDDGYGEMSTFVSELKALVEEANQLASA